MICIFNILVFFISFYSFGSNNLNKFQFPENRKTIFYTFDERIDISNPEMIAKTFLKSHISNLNNASIDLILQHKIKSPLGYHLTYIQSFEGIAVYGTMVKINVSKEGKILSVFDNSYDFYSTSMTLISEFKNLDSAILKDFFKKNFRNSEEIKIEKVIYFNKENNPTACFKIKNLNMDDGSFTQTILDRSGNIVFQKDLRMRKGSVLDTVASGKVFLPDPLTTAGVEYGSPYEDNNDGFVSQLNDEIVIKNFVTKFSAGIYYLESNYIKIKDIRSPYVAPASSTNGQFYFTRDEDGFEDVNAYYHLTVFHDYLTDSVNGLGYVNLLDEVVEIDPHGDTEDASYYYPQTPKKITFGIGGVDDAEDADVLIHEYSHAVSDDVAPGSNSGGNERYALDEGLCDYFAVSYSRALNDYNWQNMFSWDGHNPFFTGRTCATTKMYPEDMSGSDYHASGEIWSTALMKIWEQLGRNTTDKLLLQSMYSYSAGLTFPQAAMLFLQADTLLNGGINSIIIRNAFVEKGILAPVVGINDIQHDKSNYQITITNTYQFERGGDLLINNNSIHSVKAELFNITGQILKSYERSDLGLLQINSSSLKSGVYILKVNNDNNLIIKKISRF